MPISLTKIANNTASLTIKPNDEDTVNIAYYPSMITEKTLAILNSFSEIDGDTFEESFQTFNDLLVRIIKSWDVFEDEAQTIPFPLEAKRMSELPVSFRVQILGDIIGDIRPNVRTPQGIEK